MDVSEGDLYWSIATSDESRRSPYPGHRKPRPVMVTQTDPVKASNYYGGEPDTDPNATTTFGPLTDLEDYLFETEKQAWAAYAEHLREKAQKLRDKAKDHEKRGSNILEGLNQGRDPEDLMMLDYGSSPEYVDKVHEGKEHRPMETFPHNYDFDKSDE